MGESALLQTIDEGVATLSLNDAPFNRMTLHVAPVEQPTGAVAAAG